MQWSTGFDVISYPLTANSIPLGLGSVNAPRGNYPAFTLQAPTNPQALNRYSYVINNPLLYNDPYGWWTFGLGLNLNIGFGIGGTVSIMIIVDDDWNFAVVGTPGGGGYAAAGASLTQQFQYTTADTVYQLESGQVVAGASAGPSSLVTFGLVNVGPSAGAEAILAEEYKGVNVNLGVQASVGALEIHGFYENSSILWFTNILDIGNDIIDIFEGDSYSYYDDYSYDNYYYDDYYYDGDYCHLATW